MELIKSDQIDLNLAADLADPPQPRDHGKLHVSDLINEVARLSGYRKYYYGNEPSPQGWNIMAMGRLWEAMVRPAVQARATEQGVFFRSQLIKEVDGIVGSLDGGLTTLDLTRWLAVIEIKTRWTSTGDPCEHWRWMVQGMAYCWMLQVRKLWMPVLYFPRGGGPNVEFWLHEIEFEPMELVENWQLLLNAKKSLEAR